MRKVFFSIFLVLGLFASSQDLKSQYEEALGAYKSLPLDSAKKVAENYLETVKQGNEPFFQVKAYFLLAFICSKTERFGDAVIYYLEAARLGEIYGTDESNKDLISTYKNLAFILGNYKHYELAHRFIDQGIELARRTNNSKKVVDLTMIKISDILEEEKFSETILAIENLHSEFGDEINLNSLVILKNMEGIAHKKMGNLELARRSYEFILTNEPVDQEIYSYALHNIGMLHYDLKELDMAIQYFKEDIEFKSKHGLRTELILSLKDLGETYHEIGNNELALDYLSEAEQIERSEYTNHPSNHELYKLTSEVYEAMGNTEKALEYERIYTQKLEAFIAQQKEIEELDKKHNIKLLTERYFDLLAANEKRKQTERIATFGIGGSTMLFVIILSMIYYRQRRVKTSIQREIRQIEALSEV